MTRGARGGAPPRILGTAAAILLLAGGAGAQQGTATLTLEEALRLAREHNPSFLSVTNDRAPADWQLREAYSAFLPTASANSSFSWVEGGAQRFGTVDLGTSGTDWYQSYYNLSVNWQLDGNTLFGLPAARSRQRAVDARVSAAEFDLESAVTLQYMGVLRARDGLEVAERQLEHARRSFQIVSTRVASGAAAGTDGKQAEVDLGRAEVALIHAGRQYREAMALLAEGVGVTLADDTQLSSSFPVFEPTWSRDDLLALALDSHPSLRAREAEESAARAAARQAGSRYFPTFSLGTRFQGTTQQATNRAFVMGQAEDFWNRQRSSCEFTNALIQGVPTLGGQPDDCGKYLFTDERRAAAMADNSMFPFDFTKLPLSLTFQVSIPVFTGFSRQRELAQASAAAEDARHARRAEELRLRTAVTQAFGNLDAAYRVVRLEERNRALSEEHLQMQQRRYALGATSILELADAQTRLATGEQAYLNALYDFHWNLIRLEAAVGRSIRPA